MTGRDLIESFDWGMFQVEVGMDMQVNMYPSASRVGATLVDLSMQPSLRVRVNLDDDPAIASSTLPMLAMRRSLLKAAAGVPLVALEATAARYVTMVDQAELRGDVAGADAWRLVVEAIDNAKRIAATAVAQQTWDVDE